MLSWMNIFPPADPDYWYIIFQIGTAVIYQSQASLWIPFFYKLTWKLLSYVTNVWKIIDDEIEITYRLMHYLLREKILPTQQFCWTGN